MKLHFLLLGAGFVASATAQSPLETRPTATIDAGTLQGANFSPAPNEVMFLGIPYATPPAGNCAGSLRNLWRNGTARAKPIPTERPARKPWSRTGTGMRKRCRRSNRITAFTWMKTACT